MHSTYIYALIIMPTKDGPVLDRVTFDTFSYKYEEVISNPSI